VHDADAAGPWEGCRVGIPVRKARRGTPVVGNDEPFDHRVVGGILPAALAANCQLALRAVCSMNDRMCTIHELPQSASAPLVFQGRMSAEAPGGNTFLAS